MTMRSFLTALLTFAIAAVLLAGGGFAWVLAQSPLTLRDGGVTATPTAARFVPRQAPVMLSLLVNPDRLEALVQSQTPLKARRALRQEWQKLKAGLLAQTGLDYRRDIRPWLGEEMTVALTALDYDRNPENGQQPGYLLAVQAKNGELAREFLQLLYAQRATAGQADLVFEQYKGVNLVYPRQRNATTATAPAINTVASAVVGDRYILFANHPKVLKTAINNVQVTALNLSQSTAYQAALANLKQPHIGLAYVNPLSVTQGIEPDTLLPTLTLALTLAQRGLVADTTITGLQDTVRSRPQLGQPVAALGYLPPQTSVTAAGTDLAQLWQQVATGLGADSLVWASVQAAMASVQAPLGLDLVTNIFSWVRGDYAVSLLPNRDWILAAHYSEAAATALTQLDALAQAQNLSLAELSIAEIPVTVWTELVAQGGRVDAQVQGVHAQVGEYVLLSNSLNVMTNMVQPQRASLLENPAFKGAIAQLPVPNTGYFYLDWPKVQPLLEQQFPLLKVFDVAAQPLLENLQSLTLTGQGTANGVSHARVFLKNH
ncbi:MAG: DUF3352 domain-containing protein [Cyanobacteria bacterium P01_G01_bin.54]